MVCNDSGLCYVHVEAVRRFKYRGIIKLSFDRLVVEVNRFKEIFGNKEPYRQTIDAVEEKLLQLRNSQKSWLQKCLWSISTCLTGTAQPSASYPGNEDLTFSKNVFTSYTSIQAVWSSSSEKKEVSLEPDDIVPWFGTIQSTGDQLHVEGLLVYRNGVCRYEVGTIGFKQLCFGRAEAIKGLLGDSNFRKAQDYTPGEDSKELRIPAPALSMILAASGMRLDYITTHFCPFVQRPARSDKSPKGSEGSVSLESQSKYSERGVLLL